MAPIEGHFMGATWPDLIENSSHLREDFGNYVYTSLTQVDIPGTYELTKPIQVFVASTAFPRSNY